MTMTEAIEKLCEKFGVTIGYLIPRVQRYGIVSNAVEIIICAVIIIGYVLFIKSLIRKYDDLEIIDDPLELVIMFGGGIAMVIAFIVMVFGIHDLIEWIYAPEIGLYDIIVK